MIGVICLGRMRVLEGFNVFQALRVAKNWTPKEVADNLGKSYSMIYSVEQGIRKPSREMIQDYSSLFGVPVDFILKYMDDVYKHMPPEDLLYEVISCMREN